ncbi:MAG: glycosyltransferase family 39 protein [Candidatus Coatesbacteria bacterium]
MSGFRLSTHLAPLLAILAIGGALRFAQLDRQGLLLFDEGQLILEARGVRALAGAWTGTVAARPGARDALNAAIANGRIVFGKPAHNVLLAALLPVFPRADRATLVLSAAAGTMTILAVWALGRALYGNAAGLLAALLLALSPYHLLYSREGLSDALTVLCWTGALAAFTRPGGRAALVSGALAGLAVATNYRTLFLPALFAWLAWIGIPAAPARGAAWTRRFGPWIAGFAAPLLAFEAAYRLVLASGAGATFPGGTYAGQLAELLSFHGAQGFRFGGWLAFGDFLRRWEGTASLAVLLAVLPWQIARWRGADGFVNAVWLAPWILFSAYWDNASRFFTLLLPLVAIVKARWLVSTGAWTAARITRLPPAAFGLAIAATLVPPALRLVPRPTPYLEAADLLARSGDPRHLSTNSRLGLAYAGEGACIQMPPDDAGVRTQILSGWRWAVTDLQVFFGGFDRPEERLATTVRIAEARPSVLEAPYGELALTQFVLEQDLTYGDARALLAELRRQGPRLHVFDLWARARPGLPRP